MRRLAPSLRSFFVNLGPLITASKTGLPAVRDVLNGTTPLLASLGPFLEQLNPVLTWLSLHQQLIADFISNGAAGLAAKTTSFSGDGTGHYLRQFQPVGAETLSFAANRDAANRGNTYPPPLWLADGRSFSAGGKNTGSFALPSWDCNNTGAPGDGSVAASARRPLDQPDRDPGLLGGAAAGVAAGPERQVPAHRARHVLQQVAAGCLRRRVGHGASRGGSERNSAKIRRNPPGAPR